MICGIELFIKISEEKAIWLCDKFNLCVKKHFHSKQERLIHDKPNSYIRDGTYRNLIIEVRRSGNEYSLTLRGSLHKFYHSNNKGFFAGSEILDARDTLCAVFQINSNEVSIQNIEIGTNIQVWFKDVYHYLKNNLLYHKKKSPEVISKTHKVGFVFKHEDYLLKFYYKGVNLLRYELKITSVKILKEYELEFLSDVTEATVNNLIMDCLLREFTEVVMANGLNLFKKDNRDDLLSAKDRESLLEFTSQLYINSYNQTLKEVDMAKKNSMRQQNYRLKKKCLDLIREYGNHDNEKLFELMCSQVEAFINSWNDPEPMNQLNVTNSAIIKEGENVTLSSLYIQDNIKTIKHLNKTKSKKQINKEKIEQDKKVMNDFHSLLAITLKKIERKAA